MPKKKQTRKLIIEARPVGVLGFSIPVDHLLEELKKNKVTYKIEKIEKPFSQQRVKITDNKSKIYYSESIEKCDISEIVSILKGAR